jgi:hypothetical protein
LYNFAPNNWEKNKLSHKACFVNLTWVADEIWHSVVLDELPFGSIRKYKRSDISNIIPDESLPLLSMSLVPLPRFNQVLPTSMQNNFTPNWRATISLISPFAETSYQGELDPFPISGSLLTFAPFLQFGKNVENYILILNLEKNPQKRKSKLEIYNSFNPSFMLGDFTVRNNAVSKISLDDFGFDREDLPIITCKNMAGIPLYFSKTIDGTFLSLEHTHPPASLVIHGERWKVQKMLKKEWFAKIYDKSY